METIVMNLAELVKPDTNVRIHTKKQIQEFCKSIKMFGQIRPIVIDEANTVLAGNGLMEALIEMGETTASVMRFEGLTDNQKKKLMIADNKIFSLGTDNLDAFNQILEELYQTGDDLQVPGYDEEVLRTLVAEAEEVTKQISNYGILGEEKVREIQEGTARREEREEAQARREEQATPSYAPPATNTEQAQSVSQYTPPPPAPTEQSENYVPAPLAVAQVATEKTVCCPHCGKEFELV